MQHTLTGKTPTGRSVRVFSRTIPTGKSIWSLAQGNVIWFNGTFDECETMLLKVVSEGFRTTEGDIL